MKIVFDDDREDIVIGSKKDHKKIKISKKKVSPKKGSARKSSKGKQNKSN